MRPVAPTPSRFALLMDRKDQPRNLDIRVRFRIQAGKVSPAVGIVFGFAGPKSYDVLAYNQARNDLSLIKIAEPAHTTLQQTPITLPPPTTGPPDGGRSVAAPPAPVPPSGWHTLRLLVKDGQIRGWLDMNKRISTQDADLSGRQGRPLGAGRHRRRLSRLAGGCLRRRDTGLAGRRVASANTPGRGCGR